MNVFIEKVIAQIGKKIPCKVTDLQECLPIISCHFITNMNVLLVHWYQVANLLQYVCSIKWCNCTYSHDQLMYLRKWWNTTTKQLREVENCQHKWLLNDLGRTLLCTTQIHNSKWSLFWVCAQWFRTSYFTWHDRGPEWFILLERTRAGDMMAWAWLHKAVTFLLTLGTICSIRTH